MDNDGLGRRGGLVKVAYNERERKMNACNKGGGLGSTYSTPQVHCNGNIGIGPSCCDGGGQVGTQGEGSAARQWSWY